MFGSYSRHGLKVLGENKTSNIRKFLSVGYHRPKSIPLLRLHSTTTGSYDAQAPIGTPPTAENLAQRTNVSYYPTEDSPSLNLHSTTTGSFDAQVPIRDVVDGGSGFWFESVLTALKNFNDVIYPEPYLSLLKIVLVGGMPFYLARSRYSQEMITAAKYNDTDYLKSMPAYARLIVGSNAQDAQGDTALHHAIRNGNFSAASYIISNSPRFWTKNCCGRTTWYEASARGFIPVLEELKAQIKKQEKSWNPFTARPHHFSAILNQRTDKKWTPLCSAIAYGHTATADFLLDLEEIDLSHINTNGYTALFWAIKRGDYSTVIRILNITMGRKNANQSDVKCPAEHLLAHNHDGGNMLHIASKYDWDKSPNILKRLLRIDFGDDEKNPDYQNLVVRLAHQLALPRSGKLTDSTKKLGMSSRHGRSPLHEACVYGRAENINIFIELHDAKLLPIDFTHETQSGRNMFEIAYIYGAGHPSLNNQTVKSYNNVISSVKDRIEQVYNRRVKVVDKRLIEFEKLSQSDKSDNTLIISRLKAAIEDIFSEQEPSYHRNFQEKIQEYIDEHINGQTDAYCKARFLLYAEKIRIYAGMFTAYRGSTSSKSDSKVQEKMIENKACLEAMLGVMYRTCENLAIIDHRGNTLLHYLVRYDDPELIKGYFNELKRTNKNIDIDIFADFRNSKLVYGTPIFDSCIFNAKKAFNYLLYGEARNNEEDTNLSGDGLSANIFKQEIDETRSAETCRDLSEHYRSTLLLASAYSVRLNFMEDILKKAKEKLSPNEFIEYINIKNHFGYSALFLVAEAFFRPATPEYGCEKKAIDYPSRAYLMKMINLLLDYGAKCTQDTDYAGDASTKTSLLHLAARQKNPDLVKLLLERGADANAKDGLGSTPLHHACIANDFDTAKILVDDSASVFITNEDDMTPFHLLGFKRSHNQLKQFIKKTMQERSSGNDFRSDIVFCENIDECSDQEPLGTHADRHGSEGRARRLVSGRP